MKVNTRRTSYSLEELAKYCKRSYAYFRQLYSYKLLGDPKNTTKYSRKTIRKFTLQEYRNIRDFVRGVKDGDFTKIAKRNANKGARKLNAPAKNRNEHVST